MNNDRFRQRFAKRIDKAQSKLEQTVMKFVLEVNSRFVQKSPVDTGRFKANWNVSTGSINTGTTQRTSATKFRQKDEYNKPIINQLKINGQVVYITNSLPYSRRIEYTAWSSQAPMGVVRTTIAEMSGIIKQIAAEVKAL
jgi:hypothetical protein